MVVLVAVLLAGCGVPREAGRVAGREAALLGSVASDDDTVRQALVGQADAWDSMAAMVQRHEAFGVTVGADFVALVEQTADLARRQRELIEQGKDDPAANRQALEQMRKLWADVQRYLGE
jgi:hypothetical protein